MDLEEYDSKRVKILAWYEEGVITDRERDDALGELTMQFLADEDEAIRQMRNVHLT